MTMSIFVCCNRVEIPTAPHHANGRTQTSSHLHVVVFQDVGQQLPPVVASRNGNGGDRGESQILHRTSQKKTTSVFATPYIV